jgi:hypothetical protein
MRNGNLNILYTKETRMFLYPALHPQSIQSSGATEHSAGHVTLRSAAWQLVIAHADQVKIGDHRWKLVVTMDWL